MFESKKWNIKSSELAMKSENSIRSIWEGSRNVPNPLLELITLEIGEISHKCKF